MAKQGKLTVAAAEAMHRGIKQKYERQRKALEETELQLTVAEQYLEDTRKADKNDAPKA